MPRVSRRKARRFAVEQLEGRVVLSNYFVATDGKDTNPGTAVAPWATLQHAANVVSAGDSVDVGAGNYTGFYMTSSGTASSPIVFNAEPGVQINSPDTQTRQDGIDLESASYVTIQGFDVVGMPRSGIRVRLDNNVTLKDNVTDDNVDWGIYTSHSDYLDIVGNTASRSQQQHGIYIANACVAPTLIGNLIWGNANCGLQMNGDQSQGDNGLITGATIEGNIIHDNGATGGSAINMDGVQDSEVVNNLLYNNHSNGIALFQGDAAGGATNDLVVNNTIVMASDSRWAININTNSIGDTLYNNILYNASTLHGSIEIDASSRAGFVSDYNAVVNRFSEDGGDTVETLAKWRASTGDDAHSFIATPAQLFVDPTNNNYHLNATSPAIDTGTATDAPSTDLDGNPRPSGKGYDVGAYEFQQARAPATVNATSVRWGTSGNAPLFTAADGIRLLPSGRNTSTPWLDINRVVITLSQPEPISASDVHVSGAIGVNYGPVTISGSGPTYTITLAHPIDSADRVTVTVGNAEIANYTRRLDVLPGDVNDDGVVNSQDVVDERNMLPQFGVTPTVFGDIDGDGAVNITDYNLVRKKVGTKLP